MARLLRATCYWSLVLATVCLVLALIAAPIGEVRADDPNVPTGPECDDGCSIAFPACSVGKCNKVKDCKYGCKPEKGAPVCNCL